MSTLSSRKSLTLDIRIIDIDFRREERARDRGKERELRNLRLICNTVSKVFGRNFSDLDFDDIRFLSFTKLVFVLRKLVLSLRIA